MVEVAYMATIKLGRLEEVDVRKLWSHEQYDFSNWLAKEENIELLNEALGLTLVDIEKEVYVGSYRCDLVASDETTGQKIIIENQLEQSNHDHLGKVITYASGLDAKVIVWIVKDAREEHRSAVEWLNNNTNKEINFFLIEIHAYKIGDSLYAPKFEIVEKPNDFIKTGKIQASSGEMNKSQSERLAFWTRFNEVIIERGRPFNVRKASTDHWYDVAIGTSAAHLGITLVNKENCIGIELYISDDKSIFDRLYAEKDVIEKELGLTLDWQRLDGKKASRIVYRIPGLDFDDHSNYDTLMNEAIDKIVAFSKVFKKYMKCSVAKDGGPMTNQEKIQAIQAVIDHPGTERTYYGLLEDLGDLKGNYTDYMTTEPINCNEELQRVKNADYELCTALLTAILREDHFSNGSFERRQRAGQVDEILKRMVAELNK